MKCTINGIEYRMLRDFTIAEQISNKTSSSFQVIIDDPATQPAPVSGDVIEITDESTGKILFWGLCGIPATPKFSALNNWRIYSLTCSNANAILANRVINEAFQNANVSDIINTLFTNYISAEGIALGNISSIPIPINIYTASNLNLADALDELASLVSACWYVDNDRRFFFVLTSEFETFPNTINTDFLIGAELQHKTTDYKRRTVQIVTGGYDRTVMQTETFTYNDTPSFTVSFPIVRQPQVFINGTENTNVGTAGSAESDDSIVFKWSYNSPNISYVESSDVLSVGDVVEIRYFGQYPIRIVSENSAKISEIAAKTGTSGRIENVANYSSIQSIQDAVSVANSLLSQFEDVSEEVSFWLLSSQLYALGMTLDDVALLKQMDFDLPQIGVSGSFVITERQITPAAADMENAEQKFKVKLTLRNRDFMKSYGEVLSNLQQEIGNLFFREDDTVVSVENYNETANFTESVEINRGTMPLFPVESSSAPTLFSFTPLNWSAAFPSIGETHGVG